MAISSVEERLSTILTEMLGIEKARITLASRLRDDLGADSLQIVEVILNMESAFGVILTDATERIATVGELLKLVEAHNS